MVNKDMPKHIGYHVKCANILGNINQLGTDDITETKRFTRNIS